jgi:hypothetical protein
MGARPRRLLIAAFGFALSCVPAWAQAQNPGVVTAQDRFSGRIALGERSPALAAAPGPGVHYQTMSLAPGTRAAAAPVPNAAAFRALPLKGQGGYVLYELRAGKLTTIVNGNRQERREGEFWIVRPGETITLEAGDDAVLLQTLQVLGQ